MSRKLCGTPNDFALLLSRLGDQDVLDQLATMYREAHDHAYEPRSGGAGGKPIHESDTTGELATPYTEDGDPMVAQRIREKLAEAEGLIRGMLHERLEATRALNQALALAQPELASKKVTRWGVDDVVEAERRARDRARAG